MCEHGGWRRPQKRKNHKKKKKKEAFRESGYNLDMVRFSIAPPVFPMRKAPGVIPPTVAGPTMPTFAPTGLHLNETK